MRNIILGTLTISGLILGVSTIASASPATPVFNSDPAVRTALVQQVDYYWNHHHYRHRSWDKEHRRWHYY